MANHKEDKNGPDAEVHVDAEAPVGSVHEGIRRYEPNIERTYRYRDYLTWSGPERYELIQGVPYQMSSPSRRHQEVSLKLTIAIHRCLEVCQSKCQLYYAPIDLLPFAQPNEPYEDATTVVQPDLLITCHVQPDDQCVIGPPQLVIEILSPTSGKRDKVQKRALYQRAGVPEYWIVDPLNQLLEVYHRKEQYTLPQFYGAEDAVRIAAVDDCISAIEINLGPVLQPS